MKNYLAKGLAALILAGIAFSSTQSKWFNNLKKEQKQRDEIEYLEKQIEELQIEIETKKFIIQELEKIDYGSMVTEGLDYPFFRDNEPPRLYRQSTIINPRLGTNIEYRIETFCPEHLKLDYIPPTKDPKVIYFWNREQKTNTIRRKELSDEEIERLI
jgi:hypothetical protein